MLQFINVLKPDLLQRTKNKPRRPVCQILGLFIIYVQALWIKLAQLYHHCILKKSPTYNKELRTDATNSSWLFIIHWKIHYNDLNITMFHDHQKEDSYLFVT